MQLKILSKKERFKINSFKSDIEIAQAATPVKVTEIAAKLGINDDELEQYGKYKAKISKTQKKR